LLTNVLFPLLNEERARVRLFLANNPLPTSPLSGGGAAFKGLSSLRLRERESES